LIWLNWPGRAANTARSRAGRNRRGARCLNRRRGGLGNVRGTGIADATKVVRVVLENTVSVPGAFLHGETMMTGLPGPSREKRGTDIGP
jgi:hypothetical protein